MLFALLSNKLGRIFDRVFEALNDEISEIFFFVAQSFVISLPVRRVDHKRDIFFANQHKIGDQSPNNTAES